MEQQGKECRSDIQKSAHSQMLYNIYGKSSKIEKGGMGSGRHIKKFLPKGHKGIVSVQYNGQKGKDDDHRHNYSVDTRDDHYNINVEPDDHDKIYSQEFPTQPTGKKKVEKSTMETTPGKETFEKSETTKALETLGVVENDIEKGEGSKGGKVIGHTKSGKAIYGGAHGHILQKILDEYPDYKGQNNKYNDSSKVSFRHHIEMVNLGEDKSKEETAPEYNRKMDSLKEHVKNRLEDHYPGHEVKVRSHMPNDWDISHESSLKTSVKKYKKEEE